MAVFTAIAAAVVSAIGITGTAATIFTAIGATVLSVGVSSLIAKRMQKSAGGLGAGQGGGRVQLPPATDNKLPVVYGSAYVGGPIIDAKLSTDQQYMWYVVALAEVSDNQGGGGGSYTFDTNNIYYDGKKVQFGANGTVTGLINNTTPQTIDTKVNGKIKIWLFTNGSSSGINTGGLSAIQILSDSSTGKGIPSGERWNSAKYTSGGQNPDMTNTCFAIVRVEYNTDAGTTSLGGLQCRITSTLTKPGDVILDYLLNDRYGCAVPLSRIDTASLTALNNYSDELIEYDPGPPAKQQARYRINGPLATNITCLENLQILVDSTDSWLQYNELNAKWSVVINQSYTDYATINDLFLVDSSNLIGGINVAPINLNETFNEMEVAYPNQYIKDQIDYQLIELEDYQPGVLSPNEAINKLDIDFPVINNSVQALYVGVRRILQSREDLTINCSLDYSGIQIEAGDVIRVKQEVYGWDVLNSGYGKLFRVASVAEEKYQDGSLGVSITAFEYNDTIYADRALLDFQPDPNTGLANPNIIDEPEAPRLYLDDEDEIKTLLITGIVPDVGLITHLDFNYGVTSNSETHIFYTSVDNSNGTPLTGNLVAGELLTGNQYSIISFDDGIGGATTDWTLVGATKIDLSTAPAVGGFLIVGKQYIIETIGTTDFTLVGAASNTVGEIFIATGLGEGTGTALLTDFVATGAGTGTGSVNTSFTVPMTDLPTGNYYWSIRARNQTYGIYGPSAGPITWEGGQITPVNTVDGVDLLYNVGTVVTHTGANTIPLGSTAVIIGGTGEFAANTYVTQINSSTEFVVSVTPTITIANALGRFYGTRTDAPLGGGGTPSGPTPGTGAGGINGGTTIEYNSITFNQLGSNTGAQRKNAVWRLETAESGVPVAWTPVDITTAIGLGSNLYTLEAAGAWADTSFYLDGTTVGSTVTYPFAQGTSSTSIGYQINSSGPFAPSRAEQLDILTGEDGWWPIGYATFSEVIPSGQFVQFNLNASFVSDTDTVIQVLPFIKFQYWAGFPNGTVMSADTSHDMYTIELKAYYPYVYSTYSSIVGVSGTGAIASYNGAGMCIRNMVGGTRVWCTLSDGIIYQSK